MAHTPEGEQEQSIEEALFEGMLAFERHMLPATLYVEGENKEIKGGKLIRPIKYKVPYGYGPDGKIKYAYIEDAIWITDFTGKVDPKAERLADLYRAYDGQQGFVLLANTLSNGREWTSKTGNTGLSASAKGTQFLTTANVVLDLQIQEEQRVRAEAEAAKHAPAFDAPPFDEEDAPLF